MSISGDEFKKGREGKSFKSKIERFLRENSGNAFDYNEIRDAITGKREYKDSTERLVCMIVDMVPMDIALHELLKENKIEMRYVTLNDEEGAFFKWKD